MNLRDLKRMIKKRIPALIALVLLFVALFSVMSLAVKTAFAEVGLQHGGGFSMDYQWSLSAAKEHAVILIAAFSLLCGVVPLIVYLAGGRRYWLIISLALCAVAVGCLLLMPVQDAEKMYFFEFLFFRYNFNWLPFFPQIPELVIKSMKYLFIAGGMVLSAVGFILNRSSETV